MIAHGQQVQSIALFAKVSLGMLTIIRTFSAVVVHD